MRLLESEIKYRKRNRRSLWNYRRRKKRRRSLGRFFRKLCHRRSRRKRAGFLLLLFAAVIYLFAVGAYREVFLSVKEQEDVHTVMEYSGGRMGDTLDIFRISIRLKSGEIIFFHQRTEKEERDEEIHNVRP